MSDPAYKVGEILYVILEAKMAVIPVCVVESNSRTTSEGIFVTYKVKDPRGKTSTLKPTWNVFRNPTAVRNSLYENIKKQVDMIVNKAAKIAAQWQVQNNESPLDCAAPPQGLDLEPEIDDDTAIVEMPDGTTARIAKSASALVVGKTA